MRDRRFVTLGAAAAVVVLVTFAVVTGAFSRPAQATPRPSTASNRALARAVANTLLGQVAPPAGARVVSSDPERPSVNPWLGLPATRPASPLAVDLGRFWRVPGDPKSVIDWISAHPPAGLTKSGQSAGADHGTTRFWGVTFTARSIPGRISQAQLSVGVTAADGGGTALRADAVVVWMIPRPAGERVPAGVRSVLVSVDHYGRGAFKAATVTAPGKVARLVAYVNSRQLAQPGAINCPAIGPSTQVVDLRFLGAAGTGSVPLARAVEDGCDGLRFSVRGHRQHALAEGDSVSALLHRLGIKPVRPG